MKHSKEFSVLLFFVLMVLGVSIASCDNEDNALLGDPKTESSIQISTMDSLNVSHGSAQDTTTSNGTVVPTNPTNPTVPTVPIPVTKEDSLLMGYTVTISVNTVVPTAPTDPTVPFIPVTKEDSIFVFGMH